MKGIYFSTLIILAIFSYGFIDPNLALSTNATFLSLQAPLKHLVYYQRPVTTILFLALLLALFVLYRYVLSHGKAMFTTWKSMLVMIAASACILAFSYPALTYDLFNYMATAKVAYTYRENPYVVMPIEIPNDPNLAFTRAANKLALYGPVWVFLTAIPHYAGGGSVWGTIIAFKLMNAAVYIGFSYFIFRLTKNLVNVLFFALNPLVLIEVLMNGHNDIYMMALALAALVLWQNGHVSRKIIAATLLFASWWVKGATLAVTPLLILRNISLERMLVYAYIALAVVFFAVAPLREELYPWYAVWLVTTASLLPIKSHHFLRGFTIVLSLALELRALPYMWMGYYEGPGPILRTLLTVIPVALYVLLFVLRSMRRKMV